MKCPHCGRKINIGSLLGAKKSRAKASAARSNGKLGGRPRKLDPNEAAKSVIDRVADITRQAVPPRPEGQ